MAGNSMLIIFAVAILAVVAAAAIFYNTNKTPVTTAGTTVAKLPLRVIHDTWVGDAPAYLAKEKGFFEKRGLDVEVSNVETIADRRALLASGKADVSLETIDMAVGDRGIGVPVQFFLKLDESNGADGVVASKDITSLEDLKGKQVAAQKGEVPYILLRYLMKKRGIPAGDVHFVDISPDEAGAAFVSGQVDAAGTWEPWLSKATERSGGHILVSSADAPGVIVDVAAAPESVISARPQDLKAFACGWLEAIDFIKLHRDEAYAIMAKYYELTPEEFAAQVAKLKWNDASQHLDYFKSGNALETTKVIAQIEFEDGVVPALPDASSLMNQNLALQGGECG